MTHPKEGFSALIGALEIGKARTKEWLTLFPLFGSPAGPDYLIGAEAFALGLVAFDELGDGTVPEIMAINEAEVPVLLLDGEHLEGAKQNRILNFSILIAAAAKTTLPVSCVEQGRWSRAPGTRFTPSPHHSYGRLRRLQAEAAARHDGHRGAVEQHAVWHDVDLRHFESGVRASQTGAMRDSYDMMRRRSADVIDAFKVPEPAQTGVIACADGRPVSVDVFDRPDSLARVWSRLLSGYALDASVAPADAPERTDAEALLKAIVEAETFAAESVGLGQRIGLRSPTVVGGAVVWDDAVVHLSAFARDQEQVDPEPESPLAYRTRQGR